MAELEYPDRYRIGVDPNLDKVWAVLDVPPLDVLIGAERFLLAGMMTGFVIEARRKALVGDFNPPDMTSVFRVFSRDYVLQAQIVRAILQICRDEQMGAMLPPTSYGGTTGVYNIPQLPLTPTPVGPNVRWFQPAVRTLDNTLDNFFTIAQPAPPGQWAAVPPAPVSRATILTTLEKINLRQEAPRKRAVLGHGSIQTIQFPHVSIGGILGESRVYAYVHDRPWVNLDDAIDVLTLFPTAEHLLNTGGEICVGDRAMDLLIEQQITHSEAFWMTEFPQLVPRRNLFEEKKAVHWGILCGSITTPRP